MTPRSAPGAVTALPSASIDPDVGVSSPATRFITVDLPHPEGPTMQTNSPVSISRLTPVTAVVSWPVRGATNSFSTFVRRSFGVRLEGASAVFMAYCLQGMSRRSATRNKRSIRSATTPTTIMQTTIAFRSTL